MLYMKISKRLNPKSSHHKKRNCFCFLKKISELEDKPIETVELKRKMPKEEDKEQSLSALWLLSRGLTYH